MPPLHTLIAFAGASFAIIVVPGPSVLFIVSRGVALGRKAALATVMGNTTGAFLQACAVALGLGAIVARSIAVFTAIKLLGAAYLVYMGVQMIRSRHELVNAMEAGVEPKPTSRIYREGFIVGVTNPKVTVFFAAVLPQFVHRESGRVPVQMVILSLIFAAVSILSDGTWGLLAGTARQWIAKNPARLRSLGAIGGTAIIGLGIRLAISGRD